MRLATIITIQFLFAFTVMGASPSSVDQGIARLRSNPEISLYQEEETGRVRYVMGQLSAPVAAGGEVDAVLEFLQENRTAFQMKSPSDELQVRRLDIDPLGMKHVRLTQYHQGVRVFGGSMIAHFATDGVMKAINGTFVEAIELDPVPRLSASDATQYAEADLESFFGKGTPGQPELVVFPWLDENYLAWRIELFSQVPMGRWEYFVEAHTGEVIFKANRIMDADAIGTGVGVLGGSRPHLDTDDNGAAFRMIDATRRAANDPHGHGGQMGPTNVIQTYIAGGSLPGTIATDADNVWDNSNQASAVDGHLWSALMYDWMLAAFNRNSFDDAGNNMYTSVDYSAEGDNNAYWNGFQIVVWSWSPNWRSLAACPDVIAHEWGHAITDYGANLIYQKESGALNESFSDMIGVAFEFAHDSLDTPDWLIGENSILSGSGFRDVSNPPSFGDPDYYGGTFWFEVEGCIPISQNDGCGVHTNSGVGNKWFYLLSEGGTHHDVTVIGIGIENAIQIAYRSNLFYWTEWSNYSEAAYGTLSAADDLDPSGVWTEQVLNAWDAVGVAMPSPTLVFEYPAGRPSLLTPGEPETFDVIVTATYEGTVVSGSGSLYYKINNGSMQSTPMTELSPGHYEATLPALACGQYIEFLVEAYEATSGQFLDPGPGDWRYAAPGTDQVVIFEDDFKINQGWVGEDDWERGLPTGGGGQYGGPDPTSGHDDSFVYGYNLNGDYPNYLPQRHLTSSAIDCSGLTNVHLEFWRWLGVEQPAYDHAYIRVSNDGSSWTTVWENPVEIADIAWTPMDVDLSAVASGETTVFVRFTMGPTDGGWRYCGWNIDDVRLTAFECNALADSDVDGISDDIDNCPYVYNPDQSDDDDDTVGDVCDICPGFDDNQDTDADTVPDGCDICAGFDDAEDTDSDGVPNGCDNCEFRSNPLQVDTNNDGVGDACCCVGTVGDANGDGQPEPTIGDISIIVDHLFLSGEPLGCYQEADLNRSGGIHTSSDNITIGDVSTLIDYLFITGSELGLADCP